MKKLIAILLITVYSFSAAGLAINYHYCGGHLAKISLLNFGEKKGCSCDANSSAKDCCKDKFQYLKNDNHRTTQPAQLAELVFSPIAIIASESYLPLKPREHSSTGKIVELQRSYPRQIFLLCSVFRI